MKIDRSKINFMPLIRGPLWDLDNLPKHVYQSVESLVLQYETDADAIPPLLPEPFKPGRSPTVNVLFNDTNGVDFMAGGGYRLAVISVAAQIESNEGTLEGNYILVMPENRTLPIITGREWLGMPKFYTDITSIKMMQNGHLRCEASMRGHLMFGIDISPPLKAQNALIRKAAGNQSTKTPAFGYKYIASLNGPPDADYATIMWSDTKIDHLELGKSGELYFGDPMEADIGDFKPFIDALRSLPVRKVTQTAHSRGSMVLRNDKNGRIQLR
ncbi:MAG: acetoacetate decarboxylase family protein [Anaerolineae bacterium]|nr:acetoacetate decarboxylase family protein [Anaerolineae bacterium]